MVFRVQLVRLYQVQLVRLYRYYYNNIIIGENNSILGGSVAVQPYINRFTDKSAGNGYFFPPFVYR